MPNEDSIQPLSFLPVPGITGNCNVLSDNKIIKSDLSGGPPNIPGNNHPSLDAGSSCPDCGSDMISIRGKHPNSSRRIVCPACQADWIDAIREMINKKK